MNLPGGRIFWTPFELGSSGVVTNATVVSEKFENYVAKGCVMVVHRTAETGAATLNAKLQGYHRATDTWFDVANSDVVALADGEAGATGLRYVMLYPGATGSDADGVVLQDTNFALVNGFLPNEFRVSVTHGGTSISNTFAVTVYPLP